MRFIAAAAFLTMFAAAAFAQDPKLSEQHVLPATPQQPMQVRPQPQAALDNNYQIPPQIAQGEADYAAAQSKLTPSQKEQLQKLDEEFIATMIPILESYDIGGKVLFCFSASGASGIPDNVGAYTAAFRALHAEKIKEQIGLWNGHREKAIKIDFIAHHLMDKHYEYIETLQKTVAEQMVTRAGAAGAYRQTNCSALQQQLDASAARAAGSSAAPSDPAAGQGESTPPAPVQAPDGSVSGTLGTPAP